MIPTSTLRPQVQHHSSQLQGVNSAESILKSWVQEYVIKRERKFRSDQQCILQQHYSNISRFLASLHQKRKQTYPSACDESLTIHFYYIVTIILFLFSPRILTCVDGSIKCINYFLFIMQFLYLSGYGRELFTG